MYPTRAGPWPVRAIVLNDRVGQATGIRSH